MICITIHIVLNRLNQPIWLTNVQQTQLGHFKLVFHFVMNKKPIREEQKNKLEVAQNVIVFFLFFLSQIWYIVESKQRNITTCLRDMHQT